MTLGDRMKAYENTWRFYLPPRMPVIIRVDGKAFHTLTRSCDRPFSTLFGEAMDEAAMHLVTEVQNARCAYVQSDEISLLLIDFNRFESSQWLDGNIQKIVSVSACVAAAAFSSTFGKRSYFDSRAFALPEREVVNYFIDRQHDAERNSITMAAQAHYSHRELHGVDSKQKQEMLFQKGVNWNDYDPYWKRGRVATKDGIDKAIPRFGAERDYIEKFMAIEEQ